jgi:putative methyltransferase (TIGR04325 family)
MNIRDFIPPIFSKLIQKFRSSEVQKFRNFDEALANCSSDGYQNKLLCRVIAQKTQIYKQILLKKPYALNTNQAFLHLAISQCILLNGQSTINVLDFGGACGAHYYELRRLLPKQIRLNWCVIETPPMVSAANHINGNKELIFSDSISRVDKKIDFVCTSGALQYCSDPYAQLRSLMNINPDYMFFSRMSFHQGDKDVIFIQKSRLADNGPGPLPPEFDDFEISYPHTMMSFERFHDIISQSFELEWTFEDQSGHIAIDNVDSFGRGFLYRNKSSNGT